jgi:hypothetical protein
MQVTVYGLQTALWTTGTLWALLGLSLIAGALLSGRSRSREGLLLAAVFLWIVAHFALFPSSDTRFLASNFAALSVLLVEIWPRTRSAPGV